MKKLITLLMPLVSVLSIASATDKVTHHDFYTTKSFLTQEGERMEIDIPLGLKINEEYFKEYPQGDVPYILEDRSIELFNEGKIKESALYTISSIWAGNKDYNYINELEDSNPGIVSRIRNMDSFDEFNFVVRTLCGMSNENKVQDESEFGKSENGPKAKEDNSDGSRAFNIPTNNKFLLNDSLTTIETH